MHKGGGFAAAGESGTETRAPRRRGRLDTFTIHADYCSVRLKKHHELVALTPVTETGRTYLDELETAVALDAVLSIGGDGSTTPAPTPEVVAKGKGSFVALDGPDGSPPKGKLGYWTDGVRVVSAAIEIDGDVVSTNVLGYLNAL